MSKMREKIKKAMNNIDRGKGKLSRHNNKLDAHKKYVHDTDHNNSMDAMSIKKAGTQYMVDSFQSRSVDQTNYASGLPIKDRTGALRGLKGNPQAGPGPSPASGLRPKRRK